MKYQSMKTSISPLSTRFYKGIVLASSALAMAAPFAGAAGLVVEAGTVTIAATGKYDLTDNDLIVRTTPYATIVNYVLTGAYSGVNGYWDGPGINSSVAAVQPNGLTALGVINNANFGFTAFPYDVNYNPMVGAHNTPLGTEIFVKYTYYGDSDLNGAVDTGADLNAYLSGVGNAGQGWEFGDFDLSGGPTDTGSDLNTFLAGLAGQGVPLVSQGSLSSAALPVPEPSVAGMLLVGALAAFFRRSPKVSQKD